MTEKKLQRHLVWIGLQLPVTGKFSRNITCPFVPDEVKVKQACIAGTAVYNTLLQVQCPTLTSDHKVPLTTFADPATSFVGITFPLNKSIDGTHDFTIADASGASMVDISTHQLSILLEFRRYV